MLGGHARHCRLCIKVKGERHKPRQTKKEKRDGGGVQERKEKWKNSKNIAVEPSKFWSWHNPFPSRRVRCPEMPSAPREYERACGGGRGGSRCDLVVCALSWRGLCLIKNIQTFGFLSLHLHER